jgi:hypothetical protein
VDVVIATGESAGATLSAFAKATQIALPSDLPAVPETGEALIWFARKNSELFNFPRAGTSMLPRLRARPI